MSDHRHLDAARFGTGEVLIARLSMLDGEGRRKRLFHSGERVEVEIEFRRPLDDELDPRRARRQEAGPSSVILSITRKDGVGICYLHMGSQGGPELPLLEPGKSAIARATFERFNLAPGSYQISAAAYPARIGSYPRGADDYPYDCHLRLHDFNVLAPPNDADALPPGALSIDFEATVEAR